MKIKVKIISYNQAVKMGLAKKRSVFLQGGSNPIIGISASGNKRSNIADKAMIHYKDGTTKVIFDKKLGIMPKKKI